MPNLGVEERELGEVAPARLGDAVLPALILPERDATELRHPGLCQSQLPPALAERVTDHEPGARLGRCRRVHVCSTGDGGICLRTVASDSQARRAATWAPWSPEPWRLLGEAQLAALDQASRLNPLSPEVAQFRKELGEQGTIVVGG